MGICGVLALCCVNYSVNNSPSALVDDKNSNVQQVHPPNNYVSSNPHAASGTPQDLQIDQEYDKNNTPLTNYLVDYDSNNNFYTANTIPTVSQNQINLTKYAMDNSIIWNMTGVRI